MTKNTAKKLDTGKYQYRNMVVQHVVDCDGNHDGRWDVFTMGGEWAHRTNALWYAKQLIDENAE